MKAKAHIKRGQDSGKTLCEKFDTLKWVSTSLLTKNGTSCIGKDIMDIGKLGHKRRCDVNKEKVEKVGTTYDKRIKHADVVIAKKGEFCAAWICANLKHFVMPLKVKSDGVMPSKQPALVDLSLSHKYLWTKIYGS